MNEKLGSLVTFYLNALSLEIVWFQKISITPPTHRWVFGLQPPSLLKIPISLHTYLKKRLLFPPLPLGISIALPLGRGEV